MLWGPSASAGIISITTKTGAELDAAISEAEAIDMTIAFPRGYQTPAEFYSPAHPTEKNHESNVPNYRPTLYWDPAVRLDNEGCAQVEFYTSDVPADYNVVVEEVTREGKIIRSASILRF